MMLANVYVESKSKNRRPKTLWIGRLQNAAQIAAMFAFMALLWSMWSADNFTEWFYFLRTGNI